MDWILYRRKAAKWNDILPLVRALREQNPEWGQRRFAEELKKVVPALPATDRVVELIRRWEYLEQLPRAREWRATRPRSQGA
jgi:hypothetical protein